MRRIQAYAAELTGFRELIPDWVLELPLEEKLRRSREFSAWTQTYPKNITGDAASTYWKPWILMVLVGDQYISILSTISFLYTLIVKNQSKTLNKNVSTRRLWDSATDLH